MYKPLYWDFVGMIEYVVSNYEALSTRQFELAPMVHKKYDWNRVVAEHFNNVESRLML
jgi:hypothetical protein